MAAPVCRIAPPPPAFDTPSPQLPSIPLVSINPQNWNIPQPVIQDIKLMAEAINSIQQVLAAVTNRGAPNNNLFNPGGGGGGGPTIGGVNFPNSPQQKTQTPRQPPRQQKKQGAGFVEKKRVVKKVKIVNPDDHEQYVTINQIVALTFQDPVSGVTWTWKQGDPGLNADQSGGGGG